MPHSDLVTATTAVGSVLGVVVWFSLNALVRFHLENAALPEWRSQQRG